MVDPVDWRHKKYKMCFYFQTLVGSIPGYKKHIFFLNIEMHFFPDQK